MIPGQKLSKWTWLMEDVTVRGIVRDAVDPNDHREPKQIGAELGGADAFDLEVDPNYRHLIAISGNNPTPFRSPPGCIHVEGYHHDFDNPDWINRVAPSYYPEERKEEWFKVDGRNLAVGDRIEVAGRWIIENQHENFCWRGSAITKFFRNWSRENPPSPLLVTNYGCVWTELHPFKWKEIKSVRRLPATGTEKETLCLAAPLYECTFARGGIFNDGRLRGRVAILSDKKNYREDAHARMHIKGPELPALFKMDRSLVRFREVAILNGTERSLDEIRSIEVVDDGIVVEASISAPATVETYDEDGNRYFIADKNDPANDRSVFKAHYYVDWAPRVRVAGSIGADSANLIELPEQKAGTSVQFNINLENVGPDRLDVIDIEIVGDHPTLFQVNNPRVTLPPRSTVTIPAEFKPPNFLAGSRFETYPPYVVEALVKLQTTDPANPTCEIILRGPVAAPPLASTLRLEPGSINFGAVEVGTSCRTNYRLFNTGRREVVIKSVVVERESPYVDQFKFGTAFPGMVVAPGESQSISVSFCPQHAGEAHSEAVATVAETVAEERSTSVRLSVSGTGTIPADDTSPGRNPGLRVEPTSINLGSVKVGTSSRREVSILNTGQYSVSVISAIFENESPSIGQFRFDMALPPTILRPGEGQDISVVFTPHKSGTAQAEAVVTVNSMNSIGPSSVFRISVSGVGWLPKFKNLLNLSVRELARKWRADRRRFSTRLEPVDPRTG